MTTTDAEISPTTGDLADLATSTGADLPACDCVDAHTAELVGAVETLAVAIADDPAALVPGVAVLIGIAWLLTKKKKAAPKPPQG